MARNPNPLLAAIDEGIALEDRHVSVYFAKDGEKLDIATNQGDWTRYEKAQAMAALDAWAAVSGLTFSETDRIEGATFKLSHSVSTTGSLGFFSGPDPDLAPEYQGMGWFNSGPYWGGPKSGLLDAGSYTFTIFLHEFGHGLGLSHPHEATANSTVMPQVGDGLGLDQGVYTVMTYNDGWPEAPEGLPESRAWGWNLGPSALDIAAIQEKYGANTQTGAGNDRYVLPRADEAGTGYLTIWDAGGGRDKIVAKGKADAVIDLRAATLELEEGGAGWVSRSEGVHGGFTIANGVVIERAIGARGDDRLTGNAADNLLKGKKGSDILLGGDGDDRLKGGKGGDVLDGGAGDDRLFAGPGRDRLTGGEGADVFVIKQGDGKARITDLSAEDQVDLRDFQLSGFAELEAAMTEKGARTLVDLEGARLVLAHLAPEDLVEDMFLL